MTASLIGGVVFVFLLAAAVGGYAWWSSQRPHQPASSAPGEPGTETAVGVQRLAGLWELEFTFSEYEMKEEEGTRYVQTIDAQGRVDRRVYMNCDQGPEYQWYLELESIDRGAWEGDKVQLQIDPKTGETEKLQRYHIRVVAPPGEQWMEENSPDHSLTFSRTASFERIPSSRIEELVTLRIKNDSATDVVNLYLADASDGTGFNAGEDRWGSLGTRLWSFLGNPQVDPHEDRLQGLVAPGTSCWMNLPPGVYHLRAEDIDSNPITAKETRGVYCDTTWSITD
jgi:hypothetical protein